MSSGSPDGQRTDQTAAAGEASRPVDRAGSGSLELSTQLWRSLTRMATAERRPRTGKAGGFCSARDRASERPFFENRRLQNHPVSDHWSKHRRLSCLRQPKVRFTLRDLRRVSARSSFCRLKTCFASQKLQRISLKYNNKLCLMSYIRLSSGGATI